MKRTIIATATVLLLGGCVGPHGEIDYARTALLGAGVGAGTFMLGGAIQGNRSPYNNYHNPYGRSNFGYGYGGYRQPMPYGYNNYNNYRMW